MWEAPSVFWFFPCCNHVMPDALKDSSDELNRIFLSLLVSEANVIGTRMMKYLSGNM